VFRSTAAGLNAATGATLAVGATASARLDVSTRCGCGVCVVLSDQPSPLYVVAVSLVDADGGVVSAGGVSCDSFAPASVGIVGIVPIESSYTGRLFASDVD
jgi:hypothetical protein